MSRAALAGAPSASDVRMASSFTTKRIMDDSLSGMRIILSPVIVARCTRALRLAGSAALGMALAACGMAPIRSETPLTAALAPAAESPLVKLVKASTPPGDEGLSGFRLMPAGLFSLDARVELARRAT